jgi:fumarylacetoacetase
MDSFLEASNGFGLSNLPWGVFSRLGQPQRRSVGVALGEFVVDVSALVEAGLMSGPILSQAGMDCMASGNSLNKLMSLGPAAWTEARATLQRLLSRQEGVLRDNCRLRGEALLHE